MKDISKAIILLKGHRLIYSLDKAIEGVEVGGKLPILNNLQILFFLVKI